MKQALHSEWTKLRTSPGTWWFLVGIVVTTVAISTMAVNAITCRAGDCGVDPAKLSLTGIQLGQAIVAILAVLTISNEYSTGMVHVTLAATPRRGVILAAKAVVLAGIVTLAALPAVLGSLLAGRIILPGHGITAPSITDGPVLRAAVGSILYLALIALLSLGVATAMRNSAAAIGVVLGLLYVFPILAQSASDPNWQRHLHQISPTTAGLAVQGTTQLAGLPISPWAGLGVLACWACGSLLTGGLLLHLRDA